MAIPLGNPRDKGRTTGERYPDCLHYSKVRGDGNILGLSTQTTERNPPRAEIRRKDESNVL